MSEDTKLGAAPLKFYEFFAGAGLVRLALQPSWTCRWANDHDPRKAAVYQANFGADELHVGDVGQATAGDLPLGADMAWASFPCQDLSLAGWRRGMSAGRSGTFWAFWRLMRDFHDEGRRPPLLVLENVVGLLYGEDFAGLCESLAALDLQFGALVIDAKRFLPQSRPRVFLVAADARADLASFTMPAADAVEWFPGALREAHGRLAGPARNLWRWWRLPVPAPPSVTFSDLVEDPAGAPWQAPVETERLLELMSPVNRGKVERARASADRAVGLLYKRTRGGVQRAEIRFDGIAGCLRTPQGGSSRQTVVIVEEGQVRSRLLSPREAARLMGAPDSFLLPPQYNNAYRAMGDGVAVPVVGWLADHLLTPLAHHLRASAPGAGAGLPNCACVQSRQTAEALAARWTGAPV